jgi:phosphoenolpyruvate carboxylase
MKYYHLVDRAALEDPSRKTMFVHSARRLKDKHFYMRRKIDTIYEMSLRISSASTADHLYESLTELRVKALALLNALTCHAEWESREFIASLRALVYFQNDPKLRSSLALLEHDQAIALDYFRTFLKRSDAALHILHSGALPHNLALYERLKQTAHPITQACLILMCHFDMEETCIIPLTDEILRAMKAG